MTNKEMKRDIIKSANELRKTYKVTVEINYSIPYVSIKPQITGFPEYYFQGEEASNLLDEATSASNKFQTSVVNVILWLSCGW